MDLPLSDVPGRESDDEAKGAILGHEYTEPLRWKSERARAPDRKAAVVWKLQKDR
ncbi:MAG: hypothetical protein ACJ8HQ_07215 [Chthoniobacterales bacterium]